MNEKAAAIIATLKAIPPGHVTSYGEVANRAGLPGYARLCPAMPALSAVCCVSCPTGIRPGGG